MINKTFGTCLWVIHKFRWYYEWIAIQHRNMG